MTYKSYKPIFFFTVEHKKKTTHQIFKLRHSTSSWKILVHFKFDGNNTSQSWEGSNEGKEKKWN